VLTASPARWGSDGDLGRVNRPSRTVANTVATAACEWSLAREVGL
jgi:hypothetical protein